MDIQEIFENAKKDPSLFSSINMDELLDKIENETNDYLENKTLSDISKTIFEVLSENDIELIEKYCDKLIGYRYVDKICELRIGIYCRWIKNGTNTLANGGIIVNIKIGEDHVQIVCKTANGKFISIKFDECVIFQKLTMEEQLILMSYDFIQNNEKT